MPNLQFRRSLSLHAARTLAACLTLLLTIIVRPAIARERWTVEEARAWRQRAGWLVGCNYIPRTAINQLEMWQADTFDPNTIDQELGWAAELGFNSVRVFLHDLLWEQDAAGFCQRLDQFLELAAKHKIGVMFVLFDGVWDPFPALGPQRAPKPHVHNSGWVQSPGAEVLKDAARVDALKPYVVGVVTRYRDDPRVQAWDLFNEPDNPNTNAYGRVELRDKAARADALVAKAFDWARGANPTAPLTVGVWQGAWAPDEKMSAIDRRMTRESDVISFHTYDPLPVAQQKVDSLRRFDRPLLCTEFMARPNGSRFETHLAWFRELGIAAYCWGFVAGKSQTIYPWDTWLKTYTGEPKEWFHDIFRPDGTAYRSEEVDSIRRVTAAKRAGTK